MFYYLYEVRNNINGKIYVGVHKTHDLDDGYMGSGKVINRSIEKYGIDNFTKTILEHFDSAEAMYAREKEVVNEEFLDRNDTYNLRRGGFGGFDYINKNGLCDRDSAIKAAIQKVASLREHNPAWVDLWTKSHSKGQKNRYLRGGLATTTKESASRAAQYAHTPEAKEKRSKTRSAMGFQQGEKNSQFGVKWIANEHGSRSATKEEAEIEIASGNYIYGKRAVRASCGHLVKTHCSACLKKKKTDETKRIAVDLYQKFLRSEFSSIEEFAKVNGTSQPRLSYLWLKYVDSYPT